LSLEIHANPQNHQIENRLENQAHLQNEKGLNLQKGKNLALLENLDLLKDALHEENQEVHLQNEKGLNLQKGKNLALLEDLNFLKEESLDHQEEELLILHLYENIATIVVLITQILIKNQNQVLLLQGNQKKEEKKRRGPPSPEQTNYEWGQKRQEAPTDDKKDEKKTVKTVKPIFELSGKLSEHQRITENGLLLKFSEPPDAKIPTNRHWVLIPFKDGNPLETISLTGRSSFLLGKDRNVAQIPIDHPSCSKQHAVIQFREVKNTDDITGETKKQVKPYIMDLQSTNGTLLNDEKIDSLRYIELKEKDILKFAFSSREYVVLNEEMVS